MVEGQVRRKLTFKPSRLQGSGPARGKLVPHRNGKVPRGLRLSQNHILWNRRPGLDPGLGFSFQRRARRTAQPRVKHGGTQKRST